jgi:hypothetical protein
MVGNQSSQDCIAANPIRVYTTQRVLWGECQPLPSPVPRVGLRADARHFHGPVPPSGPLSLRPHEHPWNQGTVQLRLASSKPERGILPEVLLGTDQDIPCFRAEIPVGYLDYAWTIPLRIA